MHITLEESGGLNALLRIKVEEQDYREEVDQALREQRRTLALPGFRAGKVPQGMVTRMMGKTVLNRTLMDKVSKSMTEYIRENKLRVLGHPLGREENSFDFEWDQQKEFEFTFDLGLSPQINIDLTSLPVLPYYHVKVEDKVVDDFIMGYRKEFGNFVERDSIVDETDMIEASFRQLDEQGKIIESLPEVSSRFTLRQIKDEETKLMLQGLAVNDALTIIPEKATGDASNAIYLIGAAKDDNRDTSASYQMTITGIEMLDPMPLGEELYQKVFPGESFEDEGAFRGAVDKKLSSFYDNDIRRFFHLQAKKAILSNSDVPLPEVFLKRWLQSEIEAELSAEDFDKEFQSFLSSMRWQLVQDAIAEQYGVDVSTDDLRSYFVEDMKRRIGIHGNDIDPGLEQLILETADKYLQKGENLEQAEREIMVTKLTSIFVQEIPTQPKAVTLDELQEAIDNLNPEKS